MKTMWMKILLKMVQLVECELDDMRYLSTGEKPVSDIARLVVGVRRAMVEYIDLVIIPSEYVGLRAISEPISSLQMGGSE